MSAARYTIRQANGTVVTGPVHGSGGIIGEGGLYRIARAIDRANAGLDLGIYEPLPGHVRMYPDYSADGNGEPADVDLRNAQVLA